MDHVTQRSSVNRSNKVLGLPNGPTRKKTRLHVWTNSQFNGPSSAKKRLLRRLAAENLDLRDKVVDLALQIQALRDGDRALSA
jgi:hypothetical protein